VNIKEKVFLLGVMRVWSLNTELHKIKVFLNSMLRRMFSNPTQRK
jgi:hypothetical protein